MVKTTVSKEKHLVNHNKKKKDVLETCNYKTKYTQIITVIKLENIHINSEIRWKQKLYKKGMVF